MCWHVLGMGALRSKLWGSISEKHMCGVEIGEPPCRGLCCLLVRQSLKLVRVKRLGATNCDAVAHTLKTTLSSVKEQELVCLTDAMYLLHYEGALSLTAIDVRQ